MDNIHINGSTDTYGLTVKVLGEGMVRLETSQDVVSYRAYQKEYFVRNRDYGDAYALARLGFDALNEGRKTIAMSIYSFFRGLPDELLEDIADAIRVDNSFRDFGYLMSVLTGPIVPFILDSGLYEGSWNVQGRLESDFLRPDIKDEVFDRHDIAPAIVGPIRVNLEARVGSNSSPDYSQDFLFNYRHQGDDHPDSCRFALSAPETAEELRLSMHTPEEKRYYHFPNVHKRQLAA